MKKFIVTTIFTLAASPAMGQSANKILKKADSIRVPVESYKMDVTVESSTDDVDYSYSILMGGKSKSLIQTIAPKREVGKNYLMIDEDMWVFIPKISRSVRVALNQKLSGQTSYGDISRMRWYGDYKPKIEKE